ncbi:protein of unknown function [Cupriavidus taiwanensis]|uniref:Uncharacterized protein n=1 Tax=Cupriavidus taiwanensis TaxID=164546 RepID=A0A9Q7UVH2_9BURK|nr:protein of unknown function [Cupriavidus taiwanensis]
MLPSPACGRGAGGEGRRWHTAGLYFVVPSGPHPNPLPQAGEGAPMRCDSMRGGSYKKAVKNSRRPTQCAAWRHHVDDPFPPRPELHPV